MKYKNNIGKFLSLFAYSLIALSIYFSYHNNFVEKKNFSSNFKQINDFNEKFRINKDSFPFYLELLDFR